MTLKCGSGWPAVVYALRKWLFFVLLSCSSRTHACAHTHMGVHERFRNTRSQALYTMTVLRWASSRFALPKPIGGLSCLIMTMVDPSFVMLYQDLLPPAADRPCRSRRHRRLVQSAESSCRDGHWLLPVEAQIDLVYQRSSEDQPIDSATDSRHPCGHSGRPCARLSNPERRPKTGVKIE